MCGNKGATQAAQGVTQQQMALANQQAQRGNQQSDLYNQLMQQYMGMQQGQLNPLFSQMGSLSNILQGNAQNIGNIGQDYSTTTIPTLGGYTPSQMLPGYAAVGGFKDLAEGLSPQALASMQGNVLDQTPAKFDQARQQLQAKMASRGLGGAMGNMANEFGNLEAQKAQALSGGLRDITLQDEALRNQNMQANRLFGADLGKYNTDMLMKRDLANQSNQQWNTQFNMNRDLANTSILDKNNQTSMANRQQTLAELLGQQGAYGNIFSNLLNQGSLANQAYNPYQWANASNSAMGNANQATGLGLQGAGQNAQLASSQRGFWDSFGAPLLGAGIGALTGGSKPWIFGGSQP
jgi:hypothetical protein